MTRPAAPTLALLLVVSTFAACGRVSPVAPPPATAAPQAAPSSPTVPESRASPSPVPSAVAAPTPMPLSLGAPVWLGRGRIVDACFTPDARLLGVSVWSAEAGSERWWQPTNVCVIAVDVDSGGRAVAAALEDGSVMVLDAATGEARRYRHAAANAYRGDVAWSPDGTRIAFQFTGPGREEPIYLLDPESGAVREVPRSESGSLTTPGLVWSPDGQAIAQAYRRGGCGTFVDVGTGEARLVLGDEGTCYAPYHLAWSPDGQVLAAVTTDPAGRVDLRDGATGQVGRGMEGGAEALPVVESGRFLVFSPDGKLLAVRGGQSPHPVGWTSLLVWEVATGRPVARLRGHVGSEDRVTVAFSGDELVSLYATGEIARWPVGADEAEERVAARLPVLVPEPPVAWSADGGRLAVGGLRGGVTVWDAATAAPLASFGAGFRVPVLSADGKLLALTDAGTGEEVIYDLAAGQVIQRLPGASPGMQGAGFSPDGRLIAYGSGHRLLVAEVASGRPVAELTGYAEGQSIAQVIWSPDGSALAAAGDYGPVILWERDPDGPFRPVLRTEYARGNYPGRSVALFSPGGTLVALEGREGGLASIPVYDRVSGEIILTLTDYVLGTWVSDEVLLAPEAQFDCRLTWWNVRSGTARIGEARDVNANTYAPGGAWYVTASDPRRRERGLEVHDAETGDLIRSAHHGSEVYYISWSPDGRRVASLATNGTIVVWAVGAATAEARVR